MSNKKNNKKSNWGGWRKGSGAKPREGGTEKFCVSVTKAVWQDASKLWHGNRSQLFDHLLKRFVTNEATP
jgi:hypothetical protein